VDAAEEGAHVSAVQFTIPGAPVGKGRPRVAMRGKFAQHYTPEKTASYESLVKMAGFDAMQGRELYVDAVSVTLDVWVPIPASWSQRKRDQAVSGAIRPTTKPDLDNVTKAVFDGLNGIAWKDDVQVVRAVVTKRYSTTPRVEVSISHVAH
jgi:Holliday junction resolvase RusA-like endonuclease